MASVMIEAVGQKLAELGKTRDSMVLVHSHNVPEAIIQPFASLFPQRVTDAGTSPEMLAAIAAGMVRGGADTWCLAPAWKLVARGYDTLRCLAILQHMPLRLVSVASGLSASSEGAAPQMLEDIALMRALPGVAVLVPSDRTSALHLAEHCGRLTGPSYLRLTEAHCHDIHSDCQAALPLRGVTVRSGADVTICTCGIIVREALKAADVLARQGMEASVIDCFSLADLPEDAILSSLRQTGCAVVAEEHGNRGGLGEAVASLACRNYPVPVLPLAVCDRPGQSGTSEELLEYYGLSSRQIVSAAVQVWTMRRR